MEELSTYGLSGIVTWSAFLPWQSGRGHGIDVEVLDFLPFLKCLRGSMCELLEPIAGLEEDCVFNTVLS
jgi:hypothetical protein